MITDSVCARFVHHGNAAKGRKALLQHVVFYLIVFYSTIVSAQSGTPLLLPIDESPLLIHTDKGVVQFHVEIAKTEEQKSLGLMYRRDFPLNRGFLHLLLKEEPVAMWMVNTPIPLDMIFINRSGRISSVYTNAIPETSTIISSIYPVSFALEIYAGGVETYGISVGQQVIHPVICGESCR